MARIIQPFTLLPRDLPDWDEMSEQDKASAIMFIQRFDNPMWGRRSVAQNFPCEYLDDPRLVALSPKQSIKHARLVTGGSKNLRAHYKGDYAELDRLSKLATQHGRTERKKIIAAARAEESAPSADGTDANPDTDAED